jgi:hypothetical protein
MNRFSLACIGFAVLHMIVSPVLFAGDDARIQKGLSTIQPMDPYNYCKKISSIEFSGRLTGHEGYTKAAKWAAAKFKQWGLKPLNEKEGYLQAYSSPYTVIHEAEMTLLLPGENGTVKKEALALGTGFFPILYSDSGHHKAEAVFAGWGISAPDLGYDDYKGIDVKGKFVVCFRGKPDRSNEKYDKYDHHRFRMKTAKERGALGLVYIYPSADANPNGDFIRGFTPVIINEKAADLMLAPKGLKSKSLKKELLDKKKPNSFDLNCKIDYRVVSKHDPKGIGYNVVGYVEGSDPSLKDECVVLGGHYDHCGLHAGFHFAGADDNASGSAVVMEIAQAFAALDVKPKRSVVFVLFGGEEMGLMGSYYFADHVPSQFKMVDAMFNFDMVGEGDGTGCGVTERSPELKETILQADKWVNTLRRTRLIKRVGVRSSDFAPFFKKGAACASFYSNGPHLHYHRTGDTIYRINPDMLADVAKLAFVSAYKWANR